MIAYLDSSALLKLFLDDEAGAEQLGELAEFPSSRATSRLAYVEVCAGLAAARRAGRVSPQSHRMAIGDFKRAWSEFDVIEFDESMGFRAADVAEHYGLRAGDAIHLASALEIGLDGTVVVAWDYRLRLAAAAAGFLVLPQAA